MTKRKATKTDAACLRLDLGEEGLARLTELARELGLGDATEMARAILLDALRLHAETRSERDARGRDGSPLPRGDHPPPAGEQGAIRTKSRTSPLDFDLIQERASRRSGWRSAYIRGLGLGKK